MGEGAQEESGLKKRTSRLLRSRSSELEQQKSHWASVAGVESHLRSQQTLTRASGADQLGSDFPGSLSAQESLRPT